MTITTERLDALEAKATNQPLIPSYSGMLGDEGVKDVLLDLIAEVRRLQSENEDLQRGITLLQRCQGCGVPESARHTKDCPLLLARAGK